MEQEGVVTRVTRETVTVLVESHAACENCRARGACGMPGETREIVARHPGGVVNVGERVTTRVNGRNAARSVLLAYALPSALAVAMIALFSSRTSEVIAAGVTLATVAGYFLALYSLRGILARKITCTIATRDEGEENE